MRSLTTEVQLSGLLCQGPETRRCHTELIKTAFVLMILCFQGVRPTAGGYLPWEQWAVGRGRCAATEPRPGGRLQRGLAGPSRRRAGPSAASPRTKRKYGPRNTPQQRRTGVEGQQRAANGAQCLSKKSTERLACAGTSKALRMCNSCNPQRDHAGGKVILPPLHSAEAAAQGLSGLPKVTPLERQSRTQPRQTAPEAMPLPTPPGRSWARAQRPATRALCWALVGPVPTQPCKE